MEKQNLSLIPKLEIIRLESSDIVTMSDLLDKDELPPYVIKP